MKKKKKKSEAINQYLYCRQGGYSTKKYKRDRKRIVGLSIRIEKSRDIARLEIPVIDLAHIFDSPSAPRQFPRICEFRLCRKLDGVASFFRRSQRARGDEAKPMWHNTQACKLSLHWRSWADVRRCNAAAQGAEITFIVSGLSLCQVLVAGVQFSSNYISSCKVSASGNKKYHRINLRRKKNWNKWRIEKRKITTTL